MSDGSCTRSDAAGMRLNTAGMRPEGMDTNRGKERDMDKDAGTRAGTGKGPELVSKTPVSGGDINMAYALRYSDGSVVFMKQNRRENIGFFRAEAEGLAAIGKTGAIRVPRVIETGTADRGTADAEGRFSGAAGPGSSYLVMEYIERGRPAPGAYERFGHALAAMHSADTSSFIYADDAGSEADDDAGSGSAKFGFFSDNYIGSGVQINTPKDTWIEFFAECRLRPQFERAGAYFDRGERERIDRLLDHLDRYLPEPDAPSLLHGDLWAGNHMADETGEIMLIDPAVYVGHAEADIAMTELFGGYRSEFYDAYRESGLMQPGYGERRDLYNLYHLLNHLNLFGGGYLGSVRSILRRFT